MSKEICFGYLTNACFLGAKPLSFPVEPNHKLGKTKGEILSHPDPYRCLVGRIIYLTITRPELVYSVKVLYQFMHQPRQDH